MTDLDQMKIIMTELSLDSTLRPGSHRSIRYTVFAIRYIRFTLRHRRHSSDVAWK